MRVGGKCTPAKRATQAAGPVAHAGFTPEYLPLLPGREHRDGDTADLSPVGTVDTEVSRSDFASANGERLA